MSVLTLFTRDDGISLDSLCRITDNFWNILYCGIFVGSTLGAIFALARTVLLGSLIPLCGLLYRRVIDDYPPHRRCYKEHLLIIIDFCCCVCILHPLRRLRVWCSHIYPRSRKRMKVNVPADSILPQELCEIIISLCRSDRKTLLTCSLVCRAWVPISRSLLWTHIHSSDRVRYFVKLLQSPENTISPHIQTVCLQMYTKCDPMIRYQHALRALSNANAMPKRAIIAGQSLTPVMALYRHFPDIQRLSFNYGSLGDGEETSAADFRRLLWYSSLFYQLERLSIKFFRPGGTEDIPLSLRECKLPMRLRWISLKCWNRDLLHWLRGLPQTRELMAFKLKFGGHWRTLDPKPINDILRVGHRSLRFVALTIVEWDNGFPDLSCLIELRTAVFYVYHFPSAMETIASLKSSHIETVTIITKDNESMIGDYLDNFMTGIGFAFLYGGSTSRRYVPSTVRSDS
ncbi:uncharacterized protein BT62DRAFT_935175 [Guyanagaster necrorhizus]|uniref:F-box domain-containing protein n=1 Tax=Guyanagaster necrorhizus TaxID=856835 RepID=A0A9P7VMG4_9AGAR|nr:uncharacterized protein BT62DRAFT_935175 [Guyanagaster necrorhizus MCA 3950]KAG7443215.1 hypothetical protein BT62DRAFT_935175 [Guyanagaster necrorhizus MCA 3950]